MIKKFLLLTVLATALVACNNTTETADNAAAEENVMSVDQLYSSIADMVDSTIAVTGEVDHVCKHGGTKMVIFNPETEKSIHVNAGASGNFRADEVQDQDVIVYGKVEEEVVDEAYIDNLQAKLDEEMAKGVVDSDNAKEADQAKDAKNIESGDAAPKDDQKHKQAFADRQAQIDNLRAKLAKLKEEGKDHISYYSVNCDSYKVVEVKDGAKKTKVPEENTEQATQQENADKATEAKPE